MSYPSKFVEFFGPSTWKTLHSIAFNYAAKAETPTEAEKRDVIDFFRLVERLLPCESCRVHYGKYINANPVDASSRDALTRWLFDFHSAVNERTHKPQITYEEHQDDYSGWDKAKIKAYVARSPSAKLRYLADPHLGRPVHIPGQSESMMGEFGDVGKMGMLALAAFSGYAVYRTVSAAKAKKEEPSEAPKK